MISRIDVFFKNARRIFSRSEWAIRLLRLSKRTQSTGEPGLVMIQIDGLSLVQYNRALQKNHLPFMSHLLGQERYVLHSFYSGLSSNTPAVQGEIFYGVKGCIPAFYFLDRKLGRTAKMMDPGYVEGFEARLKEKSPGPGLLTDGSSYSNIFTGGSKEAHFCWAQLGLGGVLHAANPLVLPFLVLLYIDIFLRTFILLVIEFFLALFECIRGTLKGKLFLKELEFVWLRVLVCVFLRELIVAGVCMDIMRGLPIIHLNFLGYDEQAHCRGPSSRFAHWSLEGIDHAIKRIHHVIKQSPYRDYDLWIYGDHGQERTTPYLLQHGITVEEAIENLFANTTPPVKVFYTQQRHPRQDRVNLLQGRKGSAQEGPPIDFTGRQTIVTAMGPLGQIYLNKKLNKEDYDFYARKLVSELKIPLVMIRMGDPARVIAYTPMGTFSLPEQTAQVVGEDHPFLEEIKTDLICMCNHEDVGDFIIAGWSQGQDPISFPLESGAHAGLGKEETNSFALLPMDTPLKPQAKNYLRPMDLREAAQRFLNKQTWGLFPPVYDKNVRSLKLMSYNVHGCLGMDGHIAVDRIARVIARQNPDIIALQELDVGRSRSKGVNQAERIARSLEMKHHFHPAFRFEEEQYGNAILSRYPMALIKMGPLPRMKERIYYESRGAMWISLDFQGTKIQIINTHLSIWPKERLRQAHALLGSEWLGHPECTGPIIMCGDFNALPKSATYRKICQRLKDSQSLLAGQRRKHTWFGKYPLTQFDYVFVTPDFQINSVFVPGTQLDKIASDHLPLTVDLSFVSNQSNVGDRPRS